MSVIPIDEPVKLNSKSKNHNHSIVASRTSIEAPFYSVINKVLFRLIVNPSMFFKRPQIIAICIVVPTSMQKELLEKFHDCSLVGGHLGYQKTYSKLASRYYWNNMGMDVKEYINNCDICQKVKTSPFSKFTPELGTITVENPWDLVAVDFIGPMKSPSITGNKYIIVFSDYVTKWVEAAATVDCTAETTAIHYFNLIISRHGCPKRLLSDCGTSFLNKVISNINELFKVKKVKEDELKKFRPSWIEPFKVYLSTTNTTNENNPTLKQSINENNKPKPTGKKTEKETETSLENEEKEEIESNQQSNGSTVPETPELKKEEEQIPQPQGEDEKAGLNQNQSEVYKIIESFRDSPKHSKHNNIVNLISTSNYLLTSNDQLNSSAFENISMIYLPNYDFLWIGYTLLFTNFNKVL
ncbi:hypothetical protein ACTFIV_000698 [Dictyostelium citrinum]